MLKKGILLSAIVCVLMVLSTGMAEARRGIVLPTAYGYAVANGPVPYVYPAYGYQGMHPAVPMTMAKMPAPAWNGANWSYSNGGYGNGYYQNGVGNNSIAAVACNLNIRSEPYVAGRKNRNSNVIGSLNTGEQVYVLGLSGNWSYIQSAYMPLRRGYVYSSYLRVYQNNMPTSHYTAFYPAQMTARGW